MSILSITDATVDGIKVNFWVKIVVLNRFCVRWSYLLYHYHCGGYDVCLGIASATYIIKWKTCKPTLRPVSIEHAK